MSRAPYFTEKARAAAKAARLKRAEFIAQNKGALEVFAVRADHGFTWQIRKFGGVVISNGSKYFASPGAARAAGLAALRESHGSAAAHGGRPRDAAVHAQGL